MPMLAFFPWLRVGNGFSIDRYEVVPFVRGRTPGGADQAAADAVLEPYVEDIEGRPVEHATLLQIHGRPLTADLTDTEMGWHFEFAELLALAGLSARRFFQPVSYTNRDAFTFLIQAFSEPGAGIGLRARRRDGGTGIYVAPGVYRVRRPYHVPSFEIVALDLPLLQALLRVREEEGWESISEALTSFNRANTDGEFVPEQWEIVATVGAFERLLGSDHKEDELVRAFLAVWPPHSDPPPCDRVPMERRSRRSILEIWLRDFFQQRSAAAHGKLTPGYRLLWELREHLLLGAFAFPLLVKRVLVRAGNYALTDRDRVDIEVFERLICAYHFQPREEGVVPHYPWNEIREGTYSRRAIRLAVERAFAEQISRPTRKNEPA